MIFSLFFKNKQKKIYDRYTKKFDYYQERNKCKFGNKSEKEIEKVKFSSLKNTQNLIF